eukprot:Skav223940  [mRNA]  locus=scaffold1465:235372:236511:+ [translate_table: standard]
MKVLARCQRASCLEELQDLADRDLVFRLWQALQTSSVVMYKLKSHVDITQIQDPLTRYHAWGNHLADKTAGDVNREHMPDYVQLVREYHDELEQQKLDLFELFHLHLKLHKQRATLHAAILRQQGAEVTLQMTHSQQVASLQNWKVEQPWEGRIVKVDRTWASSWGPRWAHAFRAWVAAVKWKDPSSSLEGDPGVTFAELALSFCWFCGQMLPVKRTNAGGDDYLVMAVNQADVEAFQIQLGELSNLFSVFLRQMENLTHGTWFPVYPRVFCKSLYKLGARTQAFGLQYRPQFPCQQQVMAYLGDRALVHGEALNSRVLDCDIWSPQEGHVGFLQGRHEVLKTDLLDKWLKKMRRVATVSAEVKRMRQNKSSGAKIFGL